MVHVATRLVEAMVLLQRARLPPQVELEELTEEAVVVTAVKESSASVVQAASEVLQAQELVLVWEAGCRQQPVLVGDYHEAEVEPVVLPV